MSISVLCCLLSAFGISFSPPTVQRHALHRLIGDPKLPVGVTVSVNGPVINWDSRDPDKDKWLWRLDGLCRMQHVQDQ